MCGGCRSPPAPPGATPPAPVPPGAPTRRSAASRAAPSPESGVKSAQSAPAGRCTLARPHPAPFWECEKRSARGWLDQAARRSSRSSRRCASPAPPSRACSWSQCRRSGLSGCCWWPWSSPGLGRRSAPPAGCGPNRCSGPAQTAGPCRTPRLQRSTHLKMLAWDPLLRGWRSRNATGS